MTIRYLQVAISYVCIAYFSLLTCIRFQEKIRMIYDLQLFSHKVIQQRYNQIRVHNDFGMKQPISIPRVKFAVSFIVRFTTFYRFYFASNFSLYGIFFAFQPCTLLIFFRYRSFNLSSSSLSCVFPMSSSIDEQYQYGKNVRMYYT